MCNIRLGFYSLCMMKKKKIVFLTGAGMSVESGFKTFRGEGGLWEDHPVEQVATHEAWTSNPTLVTNFYNNLRKKLFKAEPNMGHRIIAALEDKYNVTVVTQNVDDLHERAGSTKVIHLHGELTKVCSEREPYNEKYIKQLTEQHPTIAPGEKAADGSLLRPFIVFFGESVPMITIATKEVLEADVFVIIGTSLNVYPAAGLVQYVGKKVPIYLIDPEPISVVDNNRVQQWCIGAVEGMKRLQSIL